MQTEGSLTIEKSCIVEVIPPQNDFCSSSIVKIRIHFSEFTATMMLQDATMKH